jgi:hypothetical protein
VYSFDPNAANMASTMRLEAWGFRNPYGIGFDPFNPELLFVTNNGADVRQTCLGSPNGGPPPAPGCAAGTTLVVRGSRPIDNDWDDLFVVNIGGDQNDQGNLNGQGNREVPFFGHPDYFHDPVSRQPLPVTDPRFCPAKLPLPNSPPFVLQRECAQFAFSDNFRAKLTVQPAFAEVTFHGSSNMFDFSRTQAFGFKGDIFGRRPGEHRGGGSGWIQGGPH